MKRIILSVILILILGACVPTPTPEIIVVTATPEPAMAPSITMVPTPEHMSDEEYQSVFFDLLEQTIECDEFRLSGAFMLAADCFEDVKSKFLELKPPPLWEEIHSEAVEGVTDYEKSANCLIEDAFECGGSYRERGNEHMDTVLRLLKSKLGD